MFLVAEIGNTNILLAIHDGKDWKHKFRYRTKENQPPVFFEVGLRDLLLEWNVTPDDIEGVGVSSVVPEINETIIDALRANTRLEPVLLTPEIFLDLDMRVPRPYEIGSDLVSNAYAAIKKYDSDCIVVDFGTALTFNVITKNRGIEGVTISPGVETAITALSGNTSQLPVVDLELPEKVIGYDTDSAIRSGVLYGYIGLVKEIISRIKEELPSDYKVIATGGLSTVIKPLIPIFDIVDKELTIDGIRFLTEKR